MSYEHPDEATFPRSDVERGERGERGETELLTTPRLSEEKRGVALSVLWWVETPEAEGEKS